MTRLRFAAILVIGTLVPFAAFAQAPAHGTPAQAQDMLHKAVEHYKAAGRTQALADFTAGKAPFRDRDLYVLCLGADHVVVANGGFPAFVGTSADSLTDAKGSALGKALWDAAAKSPQGSIHYSMLSPASGVFEEKTTFYSKVADDLLCGVGAYRGN